MSRWAGGGGGGRDTYAASQTTVLHMKRLNQTESTVFIILRVLCFQRQFFFTFILHRPAHCIVCQLYHCSIKLSLKYFVANKEGRIFINDFKGNMAYLYSDYRVILLCGFHLQIQNKCEITAAFTMTCSLQHRI